MTTQTVDQTAPEPLTRGAAANLRASWQREHGRRSVQLLQFRIVDPAREPYTAVDSFSVREHLEPGSISAVANNNQLCDGLAL